MFEYDLDNALRYIVCYFENLDKSYKNSSGGGAQGACTHPLENPSCNSCKSVEFFRGATPWKTRENLLSELEWKGWNKALRKSLKKCELGTKKKRVLRKTEKYESELGPKKGPHKIFEVS